MLGDMSQHRRISRMSIAGVALCVAFVTLVVARSPIASAGTPQGTIVPSPNATAAPVWSIVTSPNAGTTTSNYLNGVSCTSANFCMAVGEYFPSSYYQTLVEEWNGTSWSIVTSPNASTTEYNYLSSVSCTSTSFCMAAGGYCTSSCGTGSPIYQTLVEEWNGTGWSIVTSPNETTTNDNYLNGVSCTSTTFCMAAGYYYTGSTYQTLIEEWNGTSWSIVTSPNTGTTVLNALYGVSCMSSSVCWAVGTSAGSGGVTSTDIGEISPFSSWSSQTLIEEWNGTSWSIVTSPNVTTTDNEALQGIGCVSALNCIAVGYYWTGTGSGAQTLVEEWNGTSWSIVTSPNASTTANNWLNGVSCTSTSFCTAVGGYCSSCSGFNQGVQTLVEEWNGTSWSIVTSPNPYTSGNDLYGVDCVSSTFCLAVGVYISSSSYYQTLVEEWNGATETNYLQATSCTSSSFCMAVGYYAGATTDQTLIEEWNGTSWSIVTSPNTSTTQANYLESVSCTSASFCMAAGVYNGSYYQTLIEEWNGTSWSIVTSPNTSTTENNDLNSVSCTSTSFCMAAGDYNTGSDDQTLIEEWNGTSWSIVTTPDTSTTQGNLLNGVSCTTSTFCMAAGLYVPGTYDQTLIEEWNGTSWSIVTSPNTSTTVSNHLYGVSCTSTTFCMAVGYYIGSYYQTLIEEWNGTSWSIVTSPNTSTTESNYLNAVSCTSTSFCIAAGFYYTGSDDQTLIEEWNGTSWSIVTSPNTSTTESNYLNAVSCTSTSFCMATGYYYTGSDDQTLIEEFTMVCSGGSLGLTAPTSAAFPSVTLNGTNQTSTLPLTFTPDDETGTGNGWNIDVTSTTFTNASSDTLPTSASTVTGVAGVSAPTGNCSLPTNTISPYPITVPAGTTAPTAAAIYSASTGTGEGPSDVTLNFAVAVPGYAYSGAYSSTWTFTIASGP